MTKAKDLQIKNRRASFDFSFLERYIAGIQLTGTEIKSIRQGKASIAEAFCTFTGDELVVRNMHVDEYEQGTYNNHEPKRDRKLLLKKQELKKLQGKLKDQGLTIVPLRIFINDRGFAKMEIALAKGKKVYDKRESLKEKDVTRALKRGMKG